MTLLLLSLATIATPIIVREVLDKYTSTFGQKINAVKSKIYVFNAEEYITQVIIKIMGFQPANLPCK